MASPELRWEGVVRAADYLLQDSELLRVGGPLVRAGLLGDSSISVGIAFRVPRKVEELSASRGWPILRRSSGGTALLHRPGDLLWSVILPRDHPAVGSGFTQAYDRLGGPLSDSLRAAGIAASWDPPFALSETFCLFGPRGLALAVAGQAVGGAAQHLTGRTLLHHGVVQAEVERETIGEFFDLSGELLRDRLTSVRELRADAELESIGQGMLARWANRSPEPDVSS